MTEKIKPSNPADPVLPKTADEFRAFIKRTEAGDRSTRPVLRKLLESPAEVEHFGGNLAALAQRSFVDAMGGADLGFKEAVARKLEMLRAELLGENPTPVERLLVERVAACWLQVQDAELRYAQAKELTFRQADFHQRRMDACHRRYLSALKALALVRKLAVPALQINLARRQVNVVAPAAVTPSPSA